MHPIFYPKNWDLVDTTWGLGRKWGRRNFNGLFFSSYSWVKRHIPRKPENLFIPELEGEWFMMVHDMVHAGSNEFYHTVHDFQSRCSFLWKTWKTWRVIPPKPESFSTFSHRNGSGSHPKMDAPFLNIWSLPFHLIWVWVNTYRYIFSGMNIHKSQLWLGVH